MGFSEQRQSPAKQAQQGGPSSLAGGRPQSGPCIVCVDVPDPDNLLMVLRVLRDHRDHHVDIVVSPRPVSFAAIPYGPAFLEMTKREENPVPVPIVLGRVTREKQPKIRSNPNVKASEKAWFYVDEDLTNPEVKVDTDIYLEVARFRLITFLDNHGISRSRYSIYRETNLESAKTIVPGMHHSFHKPDFAFDFKDMFFYGSEKAAQIAGLTESDAQRFDAMCKAAIKASDIPQTPGGTEAAALRSSALFEAAVTKEKDDPEGFMLSQKRREDTRLLCNVYRQLKAKECSTLTYGSIEALVKKYRGTNTKPLLYLGGPFTEALKIVKALKGPRIGPIIAMAGATHGNSNIFANQFNILIDTASAQEMLRMAQAKEIDLTLLPTECVKGTAYTLSWTDFEQEVAPWSPHTSDLYHQWAPNSPVNLFDLLAAMSVTTDLYKGMQCYVTYEVSRDAPRKGQFVFKKGAVAASSGPGLKMFWNEPSITEGQDRDGKVKEEVSFAENPHMNNMKDVYLREIEWTLRRLNS